MRNIALPARPKPIEIHLSETALMIIDMQKDFLYHGGFGEFLGNDVTLLQRAIAPIQQVLAQWRALNLRVIHTREGHLPDMSDCPTVKLDRWSTPRIGDVGPMGRILIRGESGHAIIDELSPMPNEWVLDKPGKNAFYHTDLDNHLRVHGIRHLLIAGVTTDVCVFTTTTGANDHGYNAIVLEDCVASYSPSRHAATLETIPAQGGIFGYVTDSCTVLKALENQAV